MVLTDDFTETSIQSDRPSRHGMPARELVMTWAAILAATVVLVVVIYGLVTVLPSAVGAAGDAAGAVGAVGSSLADLVTGGDSAGDADGGDRADDDAASDDGDDEAGTADDSGDRDGDEEAPEPEVSVDGIGAEEDTDDGAGSAMDAETSGSTVDDSSADTQGTTVSDEPVEHETVNTTAVEDGLVRAINDDRGDAFVPALETRYQEGLWKVAGDHADSMAEHGYVGTVSPDGETNEDRFDRYRPNCKRVDDYEDAIALATALNYSTRVDSERHDDAGGLVARVMSRWENEAALTDDRYGDMGVAARHVNGTDRLYVAAAIC